MRYSAQRDTILNIIQKSSEHLTADKIYKEAQKMISNISLGTVYRNLGQLVENHLILPIQLHGMIHYDAFVENHQHFVCNECEKIYDVEISAEELVSSIQNKFDHHVSGYNIIISGTCSICKPN